MATVARAAAPSTVAGIPATARLHVVTGKGGTGKTTVAAALAMALSVGGRRTLVVEVEGRQGLAQLFDVPALSYKESRLATTEGGGEVLGLSVDAEQALLEYLDLFYSLKRSARALRRMGAIDFVTTLAPGLRDILITGKLKEAVVRTRDGRPQYDAVVLDAPPTGRGFGVQLAQPPAPCRRHTAIAARCGLLQLDATSGREVLECAAALLRLAPALACHLLETIRDHGVTERS